MSAETRRSTPVGQRPGATADGSRQGHRADGGRVRRDARSRRAWRTTTATEQIPRDLLDRMGGLGFFGGVIPERLGGLGLDYVTFAELIEEISQDLPDPRHASSPCRPAWWAAASRRSARPEQQERWLRPLAQGEIFGAAGGHRAALGQRRRRHDDDLPARGRRVRHQRRQGVDLQPRRRVVLRDLRLDATARSAGRGITAFILPRDTPGLGLHPYKDKLGFRPHLHRAKWSSTTCASARTRCSARRAAAWRSR